MRQYPWSCKERVRKICFSVFLGGKFILYTLPLAQKQSVSPEGVPGIFGMWGDFRLDASFLSFFLETRIGQKLKSLEISSSLSIHTVGKLPKRQVWIGHPHPEGAPLDGPCPPAVHDGQHFAGPVATEEPLGHKTEQVGLPEPKQMALLRQNASVYSRHRIKRCDLEGNEGEGWATAQDSPPPSHMSPQQWFLRPGIPEFQPQVKQESQTTPWPVRIHSRRRSCRLRTLFSCHSSSISMRFWSRQLLLNNSSIHSTGDTVKGGDARWASGERPNYPKTNNQTTQTIYVSKREQLLCPVRWLSLITLSHIFFSCSLLQSGFVSPLCTFTFEEILDQ